MNKIIQFGEKVEGYDVPVFNEREIRAGAGILFLFASIAFFNALLLRNYYFIKIFVIAFLTDFLIRVFINPKYAPSLILGRFAVSKQRPEYVGAPQKKFAWILGILLSTTMVFLVVIFDVRGMANLAICIFCLTLLFFESVFGICIGCWMYSKITRKKAELCPGGTCELRFKEKIQEINYVQVMTVILFVGFLTSIVVFDII